MDNQEFEAVAESTIGEELRRLGFQSHGLQSAAAESWIVFDNGTVEVVAHSELGSPPWVTIGLAGKPFQRWNVERLSRLHAAKQLEKIPPAPHRGLREILSHHAELLRNYCRAELGGDFSVPLERRATIASAVGKGNQK